MIKIAKGGWSHILVSVGVFGVAAYGAGAMGHPVLQGVMVAGGVVATAFMVYFFRDPERVVEVAPGDIVAGADGWVRRVEPIDEAKYLKTRTVRICTFLTPFDVHVNRTPIEGIVRALAYSPGRHILTIKNAASEFNEHSSIYIEGQGTRCLVKQIVGPIVRRVVYWLQEGQQLSKGDRIGIMKFGSRMDVYLPEADVEVLVKRGDRVFAGKTVLARLKPRG